MAIATVLCSAAGKQYACPEIEKGPRLKLPTAVTSAAHDAAPGFKPLTPSHYSEAVRKSYPSTTAQTLWAVISDFDGDGFCDLIVDGRNKTDSYRLCIWGSAEGPRVMTLGRRRLKSPAAPLTSALALVPRSEVERVVAPKEGETVSDGFGEWTSGKLTRIYYWKNSRFVARNLK